MKLIRLIMKLLSVLLNNIMTIKNYYSSNIMLKSWKLDEKIIVKPLYQDIIERLEGTNKMSLFCNKLVYDYLPLFDSRIERYIGWRLKNKRDIKGSILEIIKLLNDKIRKQLIIGRDAYFVIAEEETGKILGIIYFY